MKTNAMKNWELPQSRLRFLIIVVLILGIFFRFANLDRKLYWNDESVTSLRISGYTWTEIVQDSHVISVENLQKKYQRINPEKSLIDTVKGLAVEEPQLPPLYFVMARFWVQWFGNSVAVTRSLSVLISLLVFPCTYWLCLELFESSLVGWVAIALMAVSPLHVLYAQEARPYTLWTVMILLSSASLLRAMRLKTKLSWGVYAVTLGLGFYSHLFNVFVAIAHGIYVFATESRFSKITAYLLASLAALLAFTPWLFVLATNSTKSVGWVAEKIGPLTMFSRWLGNLSRIFVDLGLDRSVSFSSSFTLISLLIPLILIVLITTGYSIYFLYRKTPTRVWLFIFTLIGVTGLALVLPDLILGGRRSSTPRYLIPCYLGIQLSIAHLLATQITSFRLKIQRRKLWQLVMITLISSGILSCAISSQAKLWWNKDSVENKYSFQVARIINQANHPLVISDNRAPGIALSLSYLLNPEVQLLLMDKPNIQKIPNSFNDVFLYRSSKRLQKEIEKDYEIKPAYDHDKLWLLKKHIR